MSQTNPAQQTIKLETPIKRGESEIAEITIRKPNTGALRGVSLRLLIDLQTDTITTIVPRISEPPLTDFEAKQLEPSDLLQIGIQVVGFLVPTVAIQQSQNE